MEILFEVMEIYWSKCVGSRLTVCVFSSLQFAFAHYAPPQAPLYILCIRMKLKCELKQATSSGLQRESSAQPGPPSRTCTPAGSGQMAGEIPADLHTLDLTCSASSPLGGARSPGFMLS